jgi:hypothetical protein
MRRRFATTALLFGFASFVQPSAAIGGTTGAWKTIMYSRAEFQAPESWPVFDLETDPSRCVRYDAHVVYLGHQGDQPDCPAALVGRSTALHVEPLDARSAPRGRFAAPTATINGEPVSIATGTEMSGTIVAAFAGLGVVATITYSSDRAQAEQILQAFRRGPGAPVQGSPPLHHATVPGGARPRSTAGAVYTGEGFDACTAPSESTMSAWLASPYRELGIYIGGIQRACSQANLNTAWVADVQNMGWHLVPIYVGLQAPCATQPGLSHIDSKKAEAQGIDAAADAVVQAGAVGIPGNNPIYFDMESYDNSNVSCVDTVMTFISAWTGELHDLGYIAGMYGGAASGISDLADIYGDPDYNQLDDIWYAHWDGKHTVFGDPYFPDTVWPNHQRLHQFAGGHDEKWGGVTINIDNDYNDGSVVGLSQSTPGDFNGDGYADLALGVPYENVGSIDNAGAVNVIYGSSTGLTSTSNKFWDQDSTGVPGTSETADHFGSALGVGDFNGDGFQDLAIGAPGEDIGTSSDAGQVTIVYGSISGLDGTGAQAWNQDSSGIGESSEDGDQFGFSLAVGDFDGNGYADLAVGVPYESLPSAPGAGGVNVIYGGPTGLTSTSDKFWSQDSSGIPDASETGDHFGYAIVAGDFNGDGEADLAVGAPGENIGSIVDAGQTTMLEGSGSGLRSSGATRWNQDTSGIVGSADTADQFGFSLAAGDLNGDGDADLGIGVPFEKLGKLTEAGGVNILYGSSAWLTSTGNQFWSQDTSGVPDASETSDHFGSALAVADFDGNAYADLAIGAPNESVGEVANAGQVTIMPGSAAGLISAGSALWNQDSTGILDKVEDGDRFGASLSARDLGNEADAELSVGVPYENVGSVKDAGAASVLYGSAAGLSSTGNQFWNQDSSGIFDSTEKSDRLGTSQG